MAITDPRAGVDAPLAVAEGVWGALELKLSVPGETMGREMERRFRRRGSLGEDVATDDERV